jgi:FAD/FMN-containing dehydrogenase
VVGSGHSFSPVAATDQTMVSLDHLRGIAEVDREGRSATVLAGTPINVLGDLLAAHGLALATRATSTPRRSPGRCRRAPTAPASATAACRPRRPA